MLGAGFPVPPSETTSTGVVFPLVIALALVIVVTALIIWWARTAARGESSALGFDRSYDEAA